MPCTSTEQKNAEYYQHHETHSFHDFMALCYLVTRLVIYQTKPYLDSMVYVAKAHIETKCMLRRIQHTSKNKRWQLRFTDSDTELVLNAALVFIGSLLHDPALT